MSEKSWAERHPVLFGALVGSVVPGIGTVAGALGGVLYTMVESDEAKKAPPQQSRVGVPIEGEEEAPK